MRFAWNMVTDVWNDFYCKILFELMPMEKNSHSITWSLSISDAFEMEAHWDSLSDWHLIMQTESALHFIVLHFERYWVSKFLLNFIQEKVRVSCVYRPQSGSNRRVFPDQESMALFFALLNSINKNRRKKKLGIIDLRSIVVHFHWSRV